MQLAAFIGIGALLLGCGGRSPLDGLDGVDASDEDVSDDAAPGAGVANVTPTVVDFGLVPCGSTASPKVVNVANTGNAVFSFSAKLGHGVDSPYSIQPATDTVAPGGFVPIIVWPQPISQVSGVASDGYGDTLTVTTTIANDPPHVVDLRETASGGIFSVSVSPKFGKNLVGTHPTTPLAITNFGNVDGQVMLSGLAAPFGVTASNPVLVPANATVTIDVAYTPDPARLGLQASSTLAFGWGPTVCGNAPPASVAFTGTSYDVATQLSVSGVSHSCAVAQSGNLYCWGDNYDGQLGDGTTTNRSTPALTKIVGATSVTATWESTCASEANKVECWGAGLDGELGYGGESTETMPVQVATLGQATLFRSGFQGDGFCAFPIGDLLKCWGSDTYGQFGTGTAATARPTPVYAFGFVNDVVDVALWHYAGCIVRSSGYVECAGVGGNGSPGSTSPVTVSGISTATAVASTGVGACALLSNGSVECWGGNENGALGAGLTSISTSNPVTVSGLTDAIALAGGETFACALRSGGSIVCWGQDYDGELGDGTNSSSNVPVAVQGITNAVAISLGGYHACALLADGTVRCWGEDDAGELGNGQTNAGSNTPVAVVGLN